MKCPICGREMEEGGIIGNGAISIDWYPKNEFEKPWYRKLIYKGGKNLGASMMKATKIPNAFYCSHCSKVVGIFDAIDL